MQSKAIITNNEIQKLQSIIKSTRDIMRKDKGLNGDVDRLPMLTWIMFLKFIDDLEKIKEEEAILAGEKYNSTIEEPYRWRDWAEKEDGITGDDLIEFVNNEKAILPNGEEGKGLFAYLRNLQSSEGYDRKDVISIIFKGTTNRMINGYILRDVINKINSIKFTSSDQVFTLSFLYESLLKEMRDAAGDAGEFYTPRPVVKLMVKVLNPQLGEKVLDPACGTAGFLVEAFEHLKPQAKNVTDYATLQKESIYGVEAKPLPYLLAQMNLLLHGLDSPNIDPGNALRNPLNEIGDKDRVDLILSNPPFGGEEEKGILDNFPADKQTANTELLFLQLIMRKLARPSENQKAGRAGVVIPNGILFGDDQVGTAIKKDLLENFNLHTVIRLPKGVFAPYTNQETSILFFDRSKPTNEIWYYEHPLPPARSKLKNPCYTKSYPVVYEEFDPILKWWENREENDFAWKVKIEEIENYNLDIKHPKHSGIQPIRTKEVITSSFKKNLEDFNEKSNKILTTIDKFKALFIAQAEYGLKSLPELNIEINPETRNPQKVMPNDKFKYIDLSCVSLNQFENVKEMLGAEAPSRARRLIKENDVLLSTVRPYLGGHGVVPADYDEQICSTGFAVLRCPESINPKYLYYMLISPNVVEQYSQKMRGAHYPALNDPLVRGIQIPDIPLPKQLEVVEYLDNLYEEYIPLVKSLEATNQQLFGDMNGLFPAALSDIFNGLLKN